MAVGMAYLRRCLGRSAVRRCYYPICPLPDATKRRVLHQTVLSSCPLRSRMFELIFANLRVRPFRTLISIVGVALGVVLVVLFTGLARGMTNDMAKRAANWKAEIVFTRPGGMDMTSSNAAVNVQYADRLLQIEGVGSTVPVIRYITSDGNGRWGIRQLDGVNWAPFAEMNGMQLVEGRAPEAIDEIIVDERQIENENLKIGNQYELFGGK